MNLPSDFAPTVRAHLAGARAYLVAESGPCQKVQREEIQRIRRDLIEGDFASLYTYTLSSFTVAAILICTLEEYHTFLEWAYDRTWNELRRVMVYTPVEMMETLRKEEVDHEIVFKVNVFKGFTDFHKHFGNVFNRTIYFDAKESEDKDA